VPVAVTDTARIFVFPPQEHAGIIAESAAPNKGVFGTTLSWRTRLPRKLTVVADASPLKLFSPTFPTDELGLGRLTAPQMEQLKTALRFALDL
jgi:hypothetical protein